MTVRNSVRQLGVIRGSAPEAPDSGSSRPARELAPAGPQDREEGDGAPDYGEAVGRAVASVLARPERGAGGRFVGKPISHGGRSRGLALALSDAKSDLAARVASDLALDSGAAAQTLLAVADAFAEISLLRRALFAKLAADGGPITGKGRTKAALASYLALADREMRLAAQLGLARRAKPVDSLEQALAAVELIDDAPEEPGGFHGSAPGDANAERRLSARSGNSETQSGGAS